MTSKPTPGPWSVNPEVAKDYSRGILKGHVCIDANGHGALAQVVWKMEHEERSPECEANACLIAAAPDLLEAARVAYDWMNNLPIPTTGCTAKMQVLFDAIAKAEGRAESLPLSTEGEEGR